MRLCWVLHARQTIALARALAQKAHHLAVDLEMARDLVFGQSKIGEHRNRGIWPRAKMVRRGGGSMAGVVGHGKRGCCLMHHHDGAVGGVEDFLGHTAQHDLA
jgi:hypothetical protein